MDLSRREFVFAGTVAMSNTNMIPQTEQRTQDNNEFQGIAYLVGPDDAKPDIGSGFFDDKLFYGYIYLAKDTERRFYTDETIDYWFVLPPFNPSVEYHGDTISNTTTETQIASYDISNQTIQNNSLFKYNVMGKYSTASTSDIVTLRFYENSNLLGEVQSGGKNSTDAPWRASLTLTFHVHNGIADVQPFISSSWNDESADDFVDGFEVNIDDVSQFRVTIQWNNAKTGNSLTRGQGYVERWR